MNNEIDLTDGLLDTESITYMKFKKPNGEVLYSAEKDSVMIAVTIYLEKVEVMVRSMVHNHEKIKISWIMLQGDNETLVNKIKNLVTWAHGYIIGGRR